MYNIGFFNMNVLPMKNRIKVIYECFFEILKDHYAVSLMPNYIKSITKSNYLRQVQIAAENYDAFFGYDRTFLQVRKSIKKNIPVILPLYADMTMGGMTLWINQSNFKINDTLLFSCKSDYDIYKKICTQSSLKTAIVPLPIGKKFEYCGNKLMRVFSNKCLHFLYVGRLTSSKNIHGLLELCRNLKGYIEFILILVGTWDYYLEGHEYKNHVENLVIQYDLVNFVIFKGYLEDDQLIQEYQNADVFINLTLNKDENFGLAQVEAMSQGLPIICSDWGGLKDHVVHGWNGYKIQTQYINGDIQLDMDKALMYTCRICNPDIRKMMSENAKQRYLEKYCRNRINYDIQHIFHNAIASSNEPVQICFSNEANSYCMQRVFCSIKQSGYSSESKYLDMYASPINED